MVKRLLFIYNPHAGKGKIRNKLMDIIGVFSENGYEVTACPTRYAGDAVDIAREKQEGYDLIVCSGGDGTLDEVVTGMMARQSGTPLGYIPGGSTNDFAVSLALPKNMLKAAQTVMEGRRFRCDVGAFNRDTFVYIAAFGIFTDVSYETPQSFKNALGHMAYILEGMKRLPTLRAYHFKVSYNGRTIEDDFLFGMITNSTSVGGFKKITGKYVELNDGLFEVMLIPRPRGASELNQIMTALVTETMEDSLIICDKAESIVFESEEPVAWTLDGEYGGEHRLAKIAIRPKAIELIVPDTDRKAADGKEENKGLLQN